MELGLLERLDPMSQDYRDKLEHIEGAVAHHVYSEELAKSATGEEHTLITRRYSEQYERYMSGNA